MDGNDIRSKPVVVQFENGDVHHYSLASASKLTIVQPGSRKLSVVQGFVLTPLMALYPLITKICLRFLHCERCQPRTLARMLDQCTPDPCSPKRTQSSRLQSRALTHSHTHTIETCTHAHLLAHTGPRMASFCW